MQSNARKHKRRQDDAKECQEMQIYYRESCGMLCRTLTEYLLCLKYLRSVRHPNHFLEVLQAHMEAAKGLFRGIRHAGSRDTSGATLRIPGRAPERLYADDDFRRGVQLLGEHGLSYDTWHYHHWWQLGRIIACL